MPHRAIVRCGIGFMTIVIITSASGTIRKPPLVKAQTALRKQWRITTFNMADGILTPCNVACGSGIMTVNSPSGSTLQCDTWLWDDMPLNSTKRPPYWNSTSYFDFDHIIAVDMSSYTSLQNFIQIGPPSAEKHDVISIFKMADAAILDFRGPIMGSLKIIKISKFIKRHVCLQKGAEALKGCRRWEGCRGAEKPMYGLL